MNNLIRKISICCLAWCFSALALACEGTGLPVVSENSLPPEARHTLQLIRQGGPFPHKRDGVIFGNFEKRLPIVKRGYYQEYTVKTPGVKTRGARRIVTGGQPPAVYYYTADHYASFQCIRPS